MIRVNTATRIAIGIVALLILPVAGAAFLSGEVRWRLGVVALKATGKLDELPWSDLLPMLKPGSGYWLQPLMQSPNPYAVINNPFTGERDIKTGRALFRSQCQSCHGPGAKGATAPALVGRELAHGWSDWAVFQTIKRGVSGTPMMPHDLPSPDLWKLVAYIKDLSTAGSESDSHALNALKLPALDVKFDELLATAGAGANWPTYYGSLNGYRYSTLDRINRDTIHQLQARWIYQMHTKNARLEVSPVAANGRLFVTDPDGGVIALDAATGAKLWRFSRRAPSDVPLCCVTANRGVALHGDTVFVATLDAKLIALDGTSGKIKWQKPIADYRKGFSSTGAPLIVKDMVITGIAGAEYGVVGFVAAFDVRDGKPLWRFDTIPKPGEKGNDTWAGDSWQTGGATTWMTGTYDAETNLIFWGIANPAPDYDASLRVGDNLYSNCVVALDADTGKLAWHFQYTPGDDHDWDSVQVPMLADVKVGAQTQKVVLQANRNGFFYALDRVTGNYLWAVPYVRQSWAERIDAGGRPVKRPEATPTSRGTLVYPGGTGATNWWPPTFNPSAQLFIVAALERPGIFFKADIGERREGDKLLGGGSTGTSASHYTAVRALDPRDGKLRWEHRSIDGHSEGHVFGLLSTAGGLVFASDQSRLIALDIDDGSLLWSFEAGGRIFSPPTTYLANGEQMIAFASGDVIVALSLPVAVKTARH